MPVAVHPSAAPEIISRRAAMLGIGCAAASVAGVAWYRLSGRSARVPDAPVKARRLLHFEDGPQQTILVRDAASLQEITRGSGERGFERGVLRTFSRARRQRGMDAGPPFELLGRADGRLTLVDTATGERVDLESFGPTNARVFAELLRAP